MDCLSGHKLLYFIFMEILSQKTLPWGNVLIGSSKYYIHAYGSVLTELAEVFETTPDIINEKLKAVNGFSADKDGELDQVIWEKIVPAFPGWSAQYFDTYNNDVVLTSLQANRGVIVFADGAPIEQPGLLHAVRYIGEGKCHDPYTGTERPTNDFPDVKAFVVLTKVEAPAAPKIEEAIPEAPKTPDVAVTMANLPLHEKNAIIAHAENALNEIKKLLGV